MIRRAVVLSLSGALLVAPPAADAATLSLDKPCYRASEDAEYLVPGRVRIGFSGTGFKPGLPVVVDADFDDLSVRASATGTIAGSFRPPRGASTTTQALRVTAKQDDNEPYVSATATSLLVGFGVKTDIRKLYDKQSRPMIRASGFYGGTYLYAHVNGGNHHRNLRLGKVTGPCGLFAGKRGPFLKRRYPGGRYRIQFDTSPKFTRTARPKYLTDQVIAAFPFGGFR